MGGQPAAPSILSIDLFHHSTLHFFAGPPRSPASPYFTQQHGAICRCRENCFTNC
jgi:hypothetical protein